MGVVVFLLILLSFILYKCRSDAKQRYSSATEHSATSDEDELQSRHDYRDDMMSEEDQLMIPVDEDDTIVSLKQRIDISEVSVSNVRYIPIASVEKDFAIRDGLNPHNYVVGDTITFRDICTGFRDSISNELHKKSQVPTRQHVLYELCQRIEQESIGSEQILTVIVYVCFLVIRRRFDPKKKANVQMRDKDSAEFKNDLQAIVDWMWQTKMHEQTMTKEEFAQNLCVWLNEV
eukprot:CAMPEP_0202702360 /NCGR_PEP_ID=MMETSP1385-20130828/15363_1 /ASSEMBLY_ACC=CAM_ASM_000861 /TAXON_ID=933848 /ORGANISM="Elphidium margaritaceum" /LENGTH=232 /DNA_ID=CAMNT_0049359997 /DNA_START=64 /DNA_END=762 /DNA_ORIENTATION=-